MSFTPKNQFKANTPPFYQKIACGVLTSGILSGGAAIFNGHPIAGIIFQSLGLISHLVCHWKGEELKIKNKK